MPPAKSKLRTKSSQQRKQVFAIESPQAKSVLLVGDFTKWQEKPINLTRDKNGDWQATVSLAPGKHEYLFLVDGQWQIVPKSSEHLPNPFGGQNAVRQVF